MEKSKLKRYDQVFLESYTKEFPCITQSRKGLTFAHCTTCNCDLKISHGGKSDIKDHIATKKHCEFMKSLQKTPKIGTFFSSTEVAGNEVINAECLFTSFVLEHNLPIAIADHAGQLFKKMFPKCEAAKKFACGRTKMTAIIKEMAYENKKSVADDLRNTVFAISVDGSNDCNAQMYPIVVMYFNTETDSIENALLALPVLSGSSTGQNIGNLLVDALQTRDIDMKNCISFSADNAPVMIGHKNGVASVLKSKNENIIVMGCLCHLIHLSAEKAAKSLPASVDDILIDIFFYLEKSAKRKEELKELQTKFDVENHKILKHVCTRWLSLGRSLKRLLEQWDVLSSFFKNQSKQSGNKKTASLGSYRIPLKTTKKRCNDASTKKYCSSSSDKLSSKKLKTNSGSALVKCPDVNMLNSLTRMERIFMFLSSDLNKAYCLFLDFIIPTFEKTNVILQSEAPKIHILNSLLLEMLKEILCKFVQPTVLKNSSLTDVKYADICNQKNDNDLLIGSATSKVVNELENNEKQQFYSNVRKYFVTCCNYIRHKFPINSDVLKHAEVADIEKISQKSFMDVQYFLDKFPTSCFRNVKESEDEAIDKLQTEFCALQIDDFPLEIIKEERMDRKWSIMRKLTTADGSLKYSRISCLMLCILTIPHSNAECERVFSCIRKTRTEFRSCLSHENLENVLIAKSMQKNHCYQQNFSNEFLNKAKSATYNHLRK